jgi:hypothetical protein
VFVAREGVEYLFLNTTNAQGIQDVYVQCAHACTINKSKLLPTAYWKKFLFVSTERCT